MQKLESSKEGNSKTCGVRLTQEQIKFIKSQGNLSEYIRNLIDKEMKESA